MSQPIATGLKYAYYPGCSLEATAKEYGQSVRAVCSHLGIELTEIPDWSCCGASSGHSTSRKLACTLAGRNLALAEEMGMDIAVACPACYIRLRNAHHEMQNDGRLREELSSVMSLSYQAEHGTRHLLDIIVNEIGLENLKSKVVKPLKGLKLAAYYGCYLVRPPELVAFDDPENPRCLDDLLSALGAEVRDRRGWEKATRFLFHRAYRAGSGNSGSQVLAEKAFDFTFWPADLSWVIIERRLLWRIKSKKIPAAKKIRKRRRRSSFRYM